MCPVASGKPIAVLGLAAPNAIVAVASPREGAQAPQCPGHVHPSRALPPPPLRPGRLRCPVADHPSTTQPANLLAKVSFPMHAHSGLRLRPPSGCRRPMLCLGPAASVGNVPGPRLDCRRGASPGNAAETRSHAGHNVFGRGPLQSHPGAAAGKALRACVKAVGQSQIQVESLREEAPSMACPADIAWTNVHSISAATW